jgi:hypothetical protein
MYASCITFRHPPEHSLERKTKSEEELGRENIRDYIRKNDGRVHYIDD